MVKARGEQNRESYARGIRGLNRVCSSQKPLESISPGRSLTHVPRSVVAIVLILLCTLPTGAQNAPTLKIRVVEGEGAVYRPGSRATRGMTVEVTDELGMPVAAASVSFVLPSGGSSGTFVSGGRTEAQASGADGRATVWGMHWNTTPGTVEIRISAVKGPARGSTICTVQLDHAPPEGSGSGGHKWLWIALATAGAAGGGIAVIGRRDKTTAAPASVATNPARIGLPTITLEKP